MEKSLLSLDSDYGQSYLHRGTSGAAVQIKKYAELRAEGDATLSKRMEMLVQRRKALNEQIRQLQEHEAKLDEKIAFYQQEIKKITDAAD